jgi:hypoxanthine phosphoribosyltransferase
MSAPTQTILFDKKAIQTQVVRIAKRIAIWFRKKKVKTLNLVSVLEGARPFTKDLVRGLKRAMPGIRIKIHETQVSGTKGTTLLKTRKWKRRILDEKTLRQFPVLIVDDLVDSGLTLETLRKEIVGLDAPEVKTAVFIQKYKTYQGPLDFCAIKLGLDHKALAKKGIKDHWLYGYGMDLDGKHRGLKEIRRIEIR